MPHRHYWHLSVHDAPVTLRRIVGHSSDVAADVITLCGRRLDTARRLRFDKRREYRRVPDYLICPTCLRRLWLAMAEEP